MRGCRDDDPVNAAQRTQSIVIAQSDFVKTFRRACATLSQLDVTEVDHASPPPRQGVAHLAWMACWFPESAARQPRTLASGPKRSV